MDFQFHKWYPTFRHLTPRSRYLICPPEFKEYLLSDGIALYGDETGYQKPPEGFHHEITKAIGELNGEVAPKLNWSAPKDGSWMLPANNMRCTSANDVYLLLKSSDFINHDLNLNPPQLVLVLREWFDLNPSSEFRCFVRNKTLIAVSQRDMNYYEFLKTEKEETELKLRKLVAEVAKMYDNFVLDAHITKTNALIIDINPFETKTDSLLFSWDELETKTQFEMRLVEFEDRSRPFSSKQYSESAVPMELVNMDKNGFKEVLEMMKRQTQQTNERSE